MPKDLDTQPSLETAIAEILLTARRISEARKKAGGVKWLILETAIVACGDDDVADFLRAVMDLERATFPENLTVDDTFTIEDAVAEMHSALERIEVSAENSVRYIRGEAA
jgi:hypothetical protein